MDTLFQKVQTLSVSGRTIMAYFLTYEGKQITGPTNGYLRSANGYFEFVPQGRYLSTTTLEITGCAVCCVVIPVA